MKIAYIALIIFLFLCGGCATENGDKADSVTPGEDGGPRKVSIVYAIQSDFPSGEIQPDRVTMDGKTIQEGAAVMSGQHTFVIEKAGYETTTVEVMVEDPGKTGVYYLTPVLKAKKRIVYFHITDSVTRAPIENPQVTMSIAAEDFAKTTPPEIVSHGAYISPGGKKVVIQKKGYKSRSDDIMIPPDENPYVLKYEMEPSK